MLRCKTYTFGKGKREEKIGTERGKPKCGHEYGRKELGKEAASCEKKYHTGGLATAISAKGAKRKGGGAKGP